MAKTVHSTYGPKHSYTCTRPLFPSATFLSRLLNGQASNQDWPLLIFVLGPALRCLSYYATGHAFCRHGRLLMTKEYPKKGAEENCKLERPFARNLLFVHHMHDVINDSGLIRDPASIAVLSLHIPGPYSRQYSMLLIIVHAYCSSRRIHLLIPIIGRFAHLYT